MFMIARVPYLFRRERPRGEGVTAFDELNALWQRLIKRSCDEQMDVLWHDCEAVQLEFVLLAIAEERLEKQVSVGRFLKVAEMKESRNREGVGLVL